MRGPRGIPLGSFPCWLRRRCESRRGLCASPGNGANKALAQPAAAGDCGGMTREEAYRRMHDLDFMTAAKILFTAPPEKKKFGLDFHLVQLFFACMPSLAVYLVAQYARHEIRRMEAEVEQKKKAEEEEKAKQAEEEAKAKEKEMGATKDEPDPEIVKVKVRLDALEEVVKEIADETKRISHGNSMKDQKGEKKEPVPIAGGDSKPAPISERNSYSQHKSNAIEVAGSPVKESGKKSSPATDIPRENVTKRGECG